jgi:hypothetical protein
MRAMKSRMIKWMGHEAGMGDNKYSYRTLVVEYEERRRQLKDVGVDDSMILKRNYKQNER